MVKQVTKEEALKAVRTLIGYIGEDPNRLGLQDTPQRVVEYYDEFFNGYQTDEKEVLSKHFEVHQAYSEMVLVKDIDFHSCCEHHLLPILGVAHVAYVPNEHIVGISKLVRLVDIFAARLQTQENMTAQIGKSIDDHLKAKGTAIAIYASHECMRTRGVKRNSDTVTYFFSGQFQTNESLKRTFLDSIK